MTRVTARRIRVMTAVLAAAALTSGCTAAGVAQQPAPAPPSVPAQRIADDARTCAPPTAGSVASPTPTTPCSRASRTPRRRSVSCACRRPARPSRGTGAGDHRTRPDVPAELHLPARLAADVHRRRGLPVAQRPRVACGRRTAAGAGVRARGRVHQRRRRRLRPATGQRTGRGRRDPEPPARRPRVPHPPGPDRPLGGQLRDRRPADGAAVDAPQHRRVRRGRRQRDAVGRVVGRLQRLRPPRLTVRGGAVRQGDHAERAVRERVPHPGRSPAPRAAGRGRPRMRHRRRLRSWTACARCPPNGSRRCTRTGPTRRSRRSPTCPGSPSRAPPRCPDSRWTHCGAARATTCR